MWGVKINITNIIIAAAAAVLAIVILVYWLYNRDTPDNNLRKARKHHKTAERLYEEGEKDLAAYHYDLANQYRERATMEEPEGEEQ